MLAAPAVSNVRFYLPDFDLHFSFISAPKNKFAGILMTAFAAFGGILFGYDTGVISGIKEMDVSSSCVCEVVPDTRTDIRT